MSTQMIVRIDPELKAKLNSFARTDGKNVSQVVRELVEAYVKDRDIGAYVDDLWNRVGNKLKAKGSGPDDIQRIIDDVRAGK
ncbi:MAG: ribbon-helix-helix protein, CopG family [Desulfobacterales bacterium]|nr:ribbon-helix-helix protein, CopG family [Desulfobacterales bacterium]